VKLVRLLSTTACVVFALSLLPHGGGNPAAAAAPAVPKAKASLAPHKATYRLRLLKTVPGEGVRAARGTMTYVLNDRCDAYTIESTVKMMLSYSDGNSQNVEQRYAAWEAKTGRYSSFTMHTLEGGTREKTYRGTITLDQNGAGVAEYEGDKTNVFKLKPGTMLSTAHTVALLEHAAAGETFFSGQVIDGSFDQGPFNVSALIASSRDGKVDAKTDKGSVTGGRYWPMSLAYFPASSKESVPEYELGMELLPTGISRSMTQDFGAFAIGFELTDIESLKPEC